MKPASQDVCARLKSEFRFFKFLPEEDFGKLAPYFSCRQTAAGETLWKEGEAGDYEAFIASGSVEVRKETEFPGKSVVVGVYNQGTVVGELCLLDGCPRAVTAITRADTSLLILTREKLDQVIAEDPELATKLLKGMLLAISIRLRKSFDRLASLF